MRSMRIGSTNDEVEQTLNQVKRGARRPPLRRAAPRAHPAGRAVASCRLASVHAPPVAGRASASARQHWCAR
eukprot:6695784-Prymnesium_polylepis.1